MILLIMLWSLLHLNGNLRNQVAYTNGQGGFGPYSDIEELALVGASIKFKEFLQSIFNLLLVSRPTLILKERRRSIKNGK